VRRRRFIQSGLIGFGGLLGGACSDITSPSNNDVAQQGDLGHWRMPDEAHPHRRTWMAFGANEAIWGAALVPQVRIDLARIAQTIAEFEPVTMLAPPGDLDLARDLVGSSVELIAAPIDDLWMRDTGPVFAKGDDSFAGVDFNFNGWGNKQEHRQDAQVATFVTEQAGVQTLRTDLVMESGSIEVDGEGTAIIAESCVLNNNRNPGWGTRDVERELGRLLGITKVIWLPGVAGHDITDGHTDFYARFAGPGVVVAGLDNDPDSIDYDVTRRHLDILRSATDARDRRLRVEVLNAPPTVRQRFADDDFAAGYVNFYVCNGAVIAPRFGDPHTDEAAAHTLQDLFPNRRVIQIDVDAIAAGGGGIHCTTQQEPAD